MRVPLALVMLAGVAQGAPERWAGRIEVPENPLQITLKAEGAPLRATLSIPAQSLKDGALQDVSREGPRLRFVLGAPLPKANWARFEVTLAGDLATGWMTQGGQSFPVVLQRLKAGEPDRAGFVGDPPPIAGRAWRGEVDLGGGQTLGVGVLVQGSTARLYIPAQGVQANLLHAVSVGDDALRFTFKPGGLLAPNAVFALKPAEGGMVGTMDQGGRSFPVKIQPVSTADVGRAPRPQEPRGPLPYTARTVRVNAAPGVTLEGTLTVPAGTGPHPAALLLSGSGPQDRDSALFGHRPFLVLADHLTRAGVAVLRLDDRGVRASTGDHAAATTEDFAADAQAAFGFLREQSEVDGARVGLVGHSEGALVAAKLIGARGLPAAWVVLLAGPSTSGRDLVLYQTSTMAAGPQATPAQIAAMRTAAAKALDLMDGDPAQLREAVGGLVLAQRAGGAQVGLLQIGAVTERALQQMRSPWYRYFVRYDPTADLGRITVPVLALFGGKDTQVPPATHAPALRAALKSSAVTIETLDGLNHLFQTAKTGQMAEYATLTETFAPAALTRISAWIRAR